MGRLIFLKMKNKNLNFKRINFVISLVSILLPSIVFACAQTYNLNYIIWKIFITVITYIIFPILLIIIGFLFLIKNSKTKIIKIFIVAGLLSLPFVFIEIADQLLPRIEYYKCKKEHSKTLCPPNVLCIDPCSTPSGYCINNPDDLSGKIVNEIFSRGN